MITVRDFSVVVIQYVSSFKLRGKVYKTVVAMHYIHKSNTLHNTNVSSSVIYITVKITSYKKQSIIRNLLFPE